MKSVSYYIVVDVPVAMVYEQWTQFEESPALHWVAEIGGRRME